MRQPSFKRMTGAVGVRVGILVWVLIVFGLATGGFWYHRYGKMHNMPRIIGGAGSIVLSDNTLAVLTNLNSAVEIRFYSLLDPATVPAASLTFAERVDRLLAEFQQVAGWKLSVTRYNSLSDADAASADGIKPFNIEKGPACFLGITVICGEQKESLPQLQPEWEPALEYDLARAILRVTTPPATVAIKAPAPVSPEITNEVLRLIPDITGTALEDGIGILRAAAVTRFVGASAEMEKQIQAAQQQVANAQNGQSDAEKQAAVKHLQQVQLEQAEKVKAIAAELQAQIATFEQMKTAAPATK